MIRKLHVTYARRACLAVALLVTVIVTVVLAACGRGRPGAGTGGSKDQPLVVMLIPSETGSSSVIDDYAPLFNAVTRVHDIHFDIKMADSYNAVIEGMVAGHIDIAFFGPVTFAEARRRGAAELLAVEETGGASLYHAGIFHRADSGMRALGDLAGKSIALGDPKSTSSFQVPVAMLLAAGVDPPRHLQTIMVAGSHSAALEQLEAGHVAAAGASLNAYDKMVAAGSLDPERVVLLAKSDPIPSPPLAMHTRLSADLKSRLRKAFHTIHQADGVTAEMLLGYGGKRVGRYNAEFDVAVFDRAMAGLARVTDELTGEILDKAGQR